MRRSETITSSVVRKYDRMRRSETITSSVMRKYDRMRRSETETEMFLLDTHNNFVQIPTCINTSAYSFYPRVIRA